MFRSYRLNALVAPLAAVVAVVTLACHEAAAQTVPFKIVGVGVAPTGLALPGQEPRSHLSAGVATHLGRYTGDGKIQTDTAVPDPATGTIEGEFGSGSPYVFTATNRDKLVCYYGRPAFGADAPGTFELTILDVLPDGNLVVEAHFIAEFVVQPNLSTGRFAGATGNWVMYAWTEPFILGSDDPADYAWAGSGTLTLKNRR
jgi:hypothetical protein